MSARIARVLIVDDEKENRDALKRALGDENPDWRILVARSEKEGLSKLREQLEKGEPVDMS